MELRKPPVGFRDLTEIKHLKIEILYGTIHNFTQSILSGYGAQGAWLLETGFTRLEQVAHRLFSAGLGLYVWDAYRPRRATLAMIDWAERTGNGYLVEEGYIAKRSRHNSGAAIDLSLYRLSSGVLLEMGTEWDCFTEESHVVKATGTALDNRLFLQKIMNDHGFVGYEKEWWHFELNNARQFALRDVPYGKNETEEDPTIC